MFNRRVLTIALSLLPTLLASAALLTGCQPKAEQSPASTPPPIPASAPPANPNLVLEATGPGLARLEVQLSAKGSAAVSTSPLKFEFKGIDGLVVGGIELPSDVATDYEITAFDAAGKATHKGRGSLPGLARNDRPRLLPLPPTGEGEGLVVSLTRERLVLDVKPSAKPNNFAAHLDVYDPLGKPTKIEPLDIHWGLTDARDVRLIPGPGRFDIQLVPKDPPVLMRICDLSTQVWACLPNGNCRPRRICVDPWTAISAGGSHTCGLTKNKIAYCWGSNTQGELGTPTTDACSNATTFNSSCSKRPLAVDCPAGAPCRFTQISSGQTLTAAIDTNGDAWWWGRGGVAHHKVSAVLAGSPVKFTRIAAGYGHACALSQARSEIWCWGTNGYGEADAPKTTLDVPDSAPVRVLAPLKFQKIVAGGEHSCAIGNTGVDVVCWGRDDDNQSSGPSSTQAPATGTGPYFFQQFGGLTPILDVTASQTSSCVTLGANNGVKCWGAHRTWNVTPFGTPEHLAAGFGQVCAVAGQVAKCVGTNNWGELGIGSMMLQSAPVAVKAPPALYADVSAGDAHTCGLTPTGDAYCWGDNLQGQIGIGTASYSVKEPALVATP